MEKLASIEGLLTFWLVVGRMGGFTISMPILGSSIIPRQVKVAFVLTLSFLIFSGLNISQQVPPSHLISYLVYLVSEMGLGFAIGYAVRLIFVGVELSGQIIGFQMGLGFAQFFDIQSVTQTSVISQFKHLLAMMIFISLNAHYFCLKALTDSFTLIPPGGFFLSPPFIKEIAGMVGDIFVISLKAGVPVILVLLLIQIVMGVINRVIPQINIFMISLPLKIGVGLLMIGLSVPYFLYFLEDIFGSLYQRIFLLLKLAGG